MINKTSSPYNSFCKQISTDVLIEVAQFKEEVERKYYENGEIILLSDVKEKIKSIARRFARDCVSDLTEVVPELLRNELKKTNNNNKKIPVLLDKKIKNGFLNNKNCNEMTKKKELYLRSLLMEGYESCKLIDEDIKYGVKRIQESSEIFEQNQTTTNLENSQEEIAKRNMDNLIAEVEAEELLKNKKGKGKTKKNVRRQLNSKKENDKNVKGKEVQNNDKQLVCTVSQNQPKMITIEERLSYFALNLLNNRLLRCLEAARIHRWSTTDLQKIKSFKDYDEHGQIVYHYENHTDELILEQRARHHLPGTELLIKSSVYNRVYTFETDRGYGVVSQLFLNKIPKNGILYLSFDKTNYCVYHKYFQDTNFKDPKAEVFKDQIINNNSDEDTQENESDDWFSNQELRIEIMLNGCLRFIYPEHELRVFPLRKDLLEAELTKVSP